MKLYPSTKKANQPLTKTVIAESCARALHEGRAVEASDSKLTGLKIIASPASPDGATFIVRKTICGENIYTDQTLHAGNLGIAVFGIGAARI